MKEKVRIIQLEPLLANQISAGEVVERPSSVVKELVENSLDAGAKKIEIEIEGAGMHLIRIRDNGHGIVKSDLILAFSRHATSKIKTTEDLAKIHTLGFRGEALASIAAVSHCRLISHAQGESEAWQIEIDPALNPQIEPIAHPFGTTVIVADLFHNIPVRRKFLRSEKTEFQLIDDMLKRLALSYPRVSFRLKHNQRQVRYYPALSSLTDERSRVGKICGQKFIENAIQICAQASSLSLQGWIGLPLLNHRQADCQYFFVNERMVKDRLLNHAIKTIYQQHPDFMEGTYPCYVLNLNIDPSEVDVNVHPTKQEVRFIQARLVHDFMMKCVTNALNQAPLQPMAQLGKMSLEANKPSNFFLVPPLQGAPAIINKPSRYAFVEEETGIIIVDLNQAKTFLIARYFFTQQGNIPSKTLLFPIPIMRMQMKSSVLEPDLKLLANLGFHLQKHTEKGYHLLKQPAILNEVLAENFWVEFLALLHDKSDLNSLCHFLGNWLSMDVFSVIPAPIFSALIQAWLKQAPVGTLMRLSHDEITHLINVSEYAPTQN